MPAKMLDGFVHVLGYKLYYRIFEPEKCNHRAANLLCLHGGPGATHDYLLPLQDIADYGYRIVFYDQLGCGKSEVPKNPALFVVERAVEELEEFRRVMHLGRAHLLGASYGGLLAIAYALKYQGNLRSLITTSGFASVPLTIRGAQNLRRKLPIEIQKTMQEFESKGDYQNPKYVEAQMTFYKGHLCRLDQWPPELNYTFEHMSLPVYGTMRGPNEFTIIGNIRYWDVTDKLHGIRVPTLVTGGKYDEVSREATRSIHNGIRGSEMVIFQESSHLAMWEERKKYMKVVSDFISNVDSLRIKNKSRSGRWKGSKS